MNAVRKCAECAFAKLVVVRPEPDYAGGYRYYCRVDNRPLTSIQRHEHVAWAELKRYPVSCTVTPESVAACRSEFILNRQWCERDAGKAREVLRAAGRGIREIDDLLHELKALKREAAARADVAGRAIGAAQAAN